MNIQLIEDHDGIADAIAFALNACGHTSSRAANGADGLAAPPADLILLDIGLPDMEGFEVLGRLKDRNDPTPVVIMTAMHDPDLRVRALSDGAIAFLQKPFTIDELSAIIDSLRPRLAA